ncbi:MAG: hypothetical protein ACOCX2_10495 [Armatimonadota bacterium]
MDWQRARTIALKLFWPALAFVAGGALVHIGWLAAYHSDWAASLECRNSNLRMLHHTFEAYSEDQDGLLPPDSSLRDLAGEWTTSGRFVRCDLSGPLGPHIAADGIMLCNSDPDLIGPDGPRPSYVWNRDLAGEQWSDLDPCTWLIRDRAGWHWGRRVNAITVGGTLTSWRSVDRAHQ